MMGATPDRTQRPVIPWTARGFSRLRAPHLPTGVTLLIIPLQRVDRVSLLSLAWLPLAVEGLLVARARLP